VNEAAAGDYTVGIDIGTTAVKAVAATADGAIVARVRRAHRLDAPRPGRLQHDAADAWVTGPREVLAQLSSGLGRPAVAVAVDAMVPSLAPVDADGNPIGPGLLYGDDRGTPTDPTAPPGQSGEPVGFLRWLAAEFPDAAGFWPAQTVANHALSGEAVVDIATAVSLAPLLGTSGGWDQALVESCGARVEQLPRIGGLGDAIGGLAGGGVMASGLVDAMGEQLVAGHGDGDALVMCGTTMLTWVVVGEYAPVERLWVLPHLSLPGRFLVGGPSNAGGLFLDWVRRLVGDEASAVTVADPSGVPVWGPWPRGERTPLHDPDRRASLHGLDLTHGPDELLQAAHEAQGFVVRHHLDLAGGAVQRLVATGGGTKSVGWMHALANVTGLPVDVSEVADGAALGAAWVARMAAGLEADMAGANRWARVGRRVEPSRAWHRAASDRYARYRELADA